MDRGRWPSRRPPADSVSRQQYNEYSSQRSRSPRPPRRSPSRSPPRRRDDWHEYAHSSGGPADYSEGYGRREDRERNRWVERESHDRHLSRSDSDHRYGHDDRHSRKWSPPSRGRDRDRSPPRRDHERARDDAIDRNSFRDQGRYRDEDYERSHRRDREDREPPSSMVMVTGVPAHADRAMVWEAFSSRGALLHDVRMSIDRSTDEVRESAYVEFQSAKEAAAWASGRRGKVAIEGGEPLRLEISRRDSFPATDWICDQVALVMRG